MTTFSDHKMPLREESSPGLPFFRNLVRFLESVLIGRVNWVGQVELQNGTTSTTVKDARVLEVSQISLMAEDAACGTAIQAAYVDTITEQTETTQGSFVIHHADPGANCNVRYSIKG